MTPIESIYEIEEAIADLQKYLHSKDRIVFKKAQIKYKQLVDRFFREHVKYVKPEQRNNCLVDVDYFIGLMDSVKDCYDMILQCQI
jgi:hypothetical protein